MPITSGVFAGGQRIQLVFLDGTSQDEIARVKDVTPMLLRQSARCLAAASKLTREAYIDGRVGPLVFDVLGFYFGLPAFPHGTKQDSDLFTNSHNDVAARLQCSLVGLSRPEQTFIQAEADPTLPVTNWIDKSVRQPDAFWGMSLSLRLPEQL